MCQLCVNVSILIAGTTQTEWPRTASKDKNKKKVVDKIQNLVVLE